VDRRFVAWDIETATIIPENAEWEDYRPYGISCAATLLMPDNEIVLWTSPGVVSPTQKDWLLAERLSLARCVEMYEYLADMQAEGYSVVTWNGMGFDFDVLAEETPPAWFSAIVALAWDSIDPGFQMACELGYMCGLGKAAKSTLGASKLMSGAQAPVLWAEGAKGQTKVLEYVQSDVRLTAELYEALLDSGRIKWVSRAGRLNEWRPFKGQLLTVGEAYMQIDPPSNPWKSRDDMIAWTNGHRGECQ